MGSAMFRRCAAGVIFRNRYFCTASRKSDELFMAAWKRTVPNIEPPKTPLAFMFPSTPTDSSASSTSKITVNLVSPYSSKLSNKQVDMVIIPAATGQMGILPGHVSSVAMLKPGLLSIYDGEEVTKYFISSGFAFVHSNSVTDIIAMEAIPIEQVDPISVQKGLTEVTEKLNTASTEIEKTEAQISMEVFGALSSALSE